MALGKSTRGGTPPKTAKPVSRKREFPEAKTKGFPTKLQMTRITPQSSSTVEADIAANKQTASPVTQPAAAIEDAALENNVAETDEATTVNEVTVEDANSEHNKVSVNELERAEAAPEGQSAPAKEMTVAAADQASLQPPDVAHQIVTVHEAGYAVANLKFPLCDAAVEKLAQDGWELADAVLEECSQPGPNGVRNASYAKIKAMREEISQNHDIDLSFERIRKLRKVAAAFPAGRRRPGVCLDAHLEAGSPEALDDIINRTPAGVAVTRAYVRSLMPREKDEEKEKRQDEWHRQVKDHRVALQNLCSQLERERDRRAEQYVELCREVGREPEPFQPVQPKDSASASVAEDLDQSLRAVLMTRGFDPTTAEVKAAINRLVEVALAQRQH